jgi:hypothetical protein
MATKKGLVESLVIRETAMGSPAAAADDAGAADAAAEEATAAADEATAAAEVLSLDVELPPQAANVTDSAPTTATAATTRPRVKR